MSKEIVAFEIARDYLADAYRVSVPHYHGGKVVTAEHHTTQLSVKDERITELQSQLAAARQELSEERLIVDRIWNLFGRPSYESLNGRSIYDLITETQQQLAASQERERKLIDDVLSIRHWKSYDSVLQVKDLRWFKEMEAQASAEGKE